jgi:hypothetical protein
VFTHAFANELEGNESTDQRSWYQIEYVIFEHLETDNRTIRYEDILFDPPESKQNQYIVKGFLPLTPFHFKQLESSEYGLSEAIHKLKRNKSIKVYDYAAWRQVINNEQTLPPIKIQHDSEETGGHNLFGEIQIKRSRFLHAAVNLYLFDELTLPYSNIIDWLFEKPGAFPFSWLLQPVAFQHHYFDALGQSQVATNISHLKQSRRIKNKEIHYIDHPTLGVIITIETIDPPAEFEEETQLRTTKALKP